MLEKPILDPYETEDLEIRLFLEAVKEYYGYDFTHYARASLRRRILGHKEVEGVDSVSQLVPLLFEDPHFFDRFLHTMSITVTSMFRNTDVFLFLRETVLPKLSTYPFINIWHAGCATGEEAYAMAILLEEEGLLNRSNIYATDYNKDALSVASKAIYPLDNMKEYTENYIKSGGRGNFIDYYQARYDSVKFSSRLSDHITFVQHNLMNDQVFTQAHLVLCRNVLIYFDQNLQNRVLDLLQESLVSRGFLVIGDRETLDFSSSSNAFETFSQSNRVYRKLAFAKT